MGFIPEKLDEKQKIWNPAAFFTEVIPDFILDNSATACDTVDIIKHNACADCNTIHWIIRH